MKPNFALSLSVEGIRLLHRAPDGWRIVGEVGLESPDLAADLSALRQTAQASDLGDLRCKLIIPNEQIRYLSIATENGDDAYRHMAAQAALEGATPYAVEELAYDLAYDLDSAGAVTHVAAVALETLQEAENFALEHQFEPVSFVATPSDAEFEGEVNFGPTHCASQLLGPGETVRPDTAAMVVLGPLDVKAKPAAQGLDEDFDEGFDEDLKAEDSVALAQDPLPEPSSVTPSPVEIPTEAPVGFSSRRNAPSEPTKRQPPPVVAKAGPSKTGPSKTTTPLAGQAKPKPPTPDTTETDAAITDSLKSGLVASFLTRRKTARTEGAHTAKAQAVSTPQMDKAETARMTVFGARDDVVGGKPRNLIFMLIAALILFMLGVSAWASVFLDDGMAQLFRRTPPTVATAPPVLEPVVPDEAVQDALLEREPDQEGATEAPVLATLETDLSPEDAAVLDALRDPQTQPVIAQPPLSDAEIESRYAVTGIWAKAPKVPDPVPLISLDDLYITSIDRLTPSLDVVTLPDRASYQTDDALEAPVRPSAPGVAFRLDPRGLVEPSVEGTPNPDGILIFAGRPSVVPPKTPVRFETTPDEEAELAAIGRIRPKPRPGDLVQQNERAQLGGLTRDELAKVRPRMRPETEAPLQAEDAPETQEPNAQAVLVSVRPDARPRNFARIVERARAAAPQATQVASIAPRSVTPKIPSNTSVAKEATVRNAIKLNRVNLIGVYGKPSSRRALIRLANGRYQKVKVGDRLDGGRVSAIGDAELRYKKGSRNLVLKIPKG